MDANFEGGGEKFPPWLYVEKTLVTLLVYVVSDWATRSSFRGCKFQKSLHCDLPWYHFEHKIILGHHHQVQVFNCCSYDSEVSNLYRHGDMNKNTPLRLDCKIYRKCNETLMKLIDLSLGLESNNLDVDKGSTQGPKYTLSPLTAPPPLRPTSQWARWLPKRPKESSSWCFDGKEWDY